MSPGIASSTAPLDGATAVLDDQRPWCGGGMDLRPSTMSASMSAGSSERGLSVVRIDQRVAPAAMRAISGRLLRSRSPAGPYYADDTGTGFTDGFERFEHVTERIGGVGVVDDGGQASGRVGYVLEPTAWRAGGGSGATSVSSASTSSSPGYGVGGQ